jgi:exosortase C (VPDSG-CTERM-specific)
LKNERQEFLAEQPSASSQKLETVKDFRHWRKLGLLTVVLALGFSLPLYDLVWFASDSELYSYMFLIPFISAYLVRLKWNNLPPFSGAARLPAAVSFAGGLTVLTGYAFACHARLKLLDDDYLAFMMSALFLFFTGACWLFLGGKIVRALAFPIALLIFIVPMPSAMLAQVEHILQYGSAWCAAGFFTMADTTYLRDGLVFQLPTINLEVAPECSGIHSSLVLFITSAIAGHLFLRTPWKRWVLLLAVIPLALLRNGFRVFVLGELCTHIGPRMIDTPIHHHGGPLFFALSLLPFFLLLFYLRKSERFNKISKT